jgi:hypothetical protein
MTWPSLQSVADKQVLYLITIGRRTGLPREMEIWFVVRCERFYLCTETVKPPDGSKISDAIPRLGSASENGELTRGRACSTVTPIADCGNKLLQSPIASMDGATGCR